MNSIENGKIRIWAPIEEVEQEALQQLKNIAALPWVFSHVAAMPDVHFGKGATVGSVIAMKEAIAPSAVGVDIGCGMGAVKTNIKAYQLPDSLSNLRTKIEEEIPVGFNQHETPAIQKTSAYSQDFDNLFYFQQAEKWLGESLYKKAVHQLATLGGGNHFIEVCLDTEQNVWLMLHSGSRGVGNILASKHIEIAKKLAHNKDLPDKDLSVFLAKTEEMNNYRHDLFWAQEYAMLNRKLMMNLLLRVMSKEVYNVEVEEEVWCHHNYVAEEIHYGESLLVTRKGAIRAYRDDMGIIPGSMGAKSFIVKGLGNPEAFCSASHGAGRRMSRGKAKKTFTQADLAQQTSGVECRKDAGVIDEIPGCYKDIEAVMNNQKDLVEIVYELKQVLCVKG